MRTLSEIISAAKLGEPTTHEECQYAVCALEALSTFDQEDLRNMGSDDHDGKTVRFAWMRYSDSFNRWKMALGKSPKDWIGWSNDPQNPAVVTRRRDANKLIDLAIKKHPDILKTEERL